MTDDEKKPPKRDPFAPLPLSEALTGKTASQEPEPTPQQPPEPEQPSPIVPSEAAATEPEPAPAYEPAPIFTPEPDEQPAWTEPAALAPPELANVIVEPMVPASYDENELRDAVGVTPIPEDAPNKNKKKKKKKTRATTDGDRDGDGDDGDRPRNKLWMLVAALAVVVGGGIMAMILVGRSNSERYLITCESDRVVIRQGRSFPPWGESSLGGAEWKPLKIPPEAPCAPFETDNKTELAARFLKMLEDRATALVGGNGNRASPTTSSGAEDPVDKVDEAEADLKQALLVARSLGGDAAIDARGRIERLLGDVTYWRASARLRAAADALTDAARQFEAASIQQPRTKNDAEGWSIHARRLAEQLRAGPGGVTATEFAPMPPTEQTPKAPPGVALPVEPADSGSAVEPAPPPIDAGAPSGGVLL